MSPLTWWVVACVAPSAGVLLLAGASALARAVAAWRPPPPRPRYRVYALPHEDAWHPAGWPARGPL